MRKYIQINQGQGLHVHDAGIRSIINLFISCDLTSFSIQPSTMSGGNRVHTPSFKHDFHVWLPLGLFLKLEDSIKKMRSEVSWNWNSTWIKKIVDKKFCFIIQWDYPWLFYSKTTSMYMRKDFIEIIHICKFAAIIFEPVFPIKF